MKKSIIVSGILSTVAIVMIAIAMTLQINKNYGKIDRSTVVALNQIDIKSMASSNKVADSPEKEQQDNSVEETAPVVVEETPIEVASQPEEETPPAPVREEVYGNLTLEELSAKIDRNLGSTVAGKGSLIATRSIELGVDPYIATAIMLHETGCSWQCSNLVISCNNVGGQKGAPGCGGGSYKSYPTLDEGIIGFIDNLYNNYYARGLNTVETIGPRYAQSTTWVSKINSYIEKIRAS